MNKFKELNDKVLQWADEKGILEHGTPLKQHDKTVEEVLELRDALVRLEENENMYDTFELNGHAESYCQESIHREQKEIKDGIGDTLVTLIIQAKMNDMDIVDCLEIAYNEIAGRTGEMKDGVFVKD